MIKKELLDELKKKMQSDLSLPLRKGATRLVFGDGDPETEILFIGEGPGYWEDQKGIPFVGNAGLFLNQLLSSINIPRDKVYITNVVHFRPPENRDPQEEEIEAFQPYLDEIIKIIAPKVIVTLGRFSMAKFLPNVRISAVHGKVHVINWNDKQVTIVPMYHPAAALRNMSVKMQEIDDFKKLPEILKKSLQEENKPESQKPVEQMKLI